MSQKNMNSVNPLKRKRIAIIIANPAVSTTTGWPVGFWWSELTHPYFKFSEKGYETTIFSYSGGACEADAMSDPDDVTRWQREDLISRGFIKDPELLQLVKNTAAASDINVNLFDAIVIAGGQAPMFAMADAVDVQKKFVEFYERGKIACALCHGVAILRYARLSNGELLAKGKTVTGFSNIEEDFSDNAVWNMNLLARDKHVMPWRIEDELRSLGANYMQAGLWKGFAVRDGNLITGQQNFSGGETADLIIQALGE